MGMSLREMKQRWAAPKPSLKRDVTVLSLDGQRLIATQSEIDDKEQEDHLYEVAIHESGHAVVAHAFGLQFNEQAILIGSLLQKDLTTGRAICADGGVFYADGTQMFDLHDTDFIALNMAGGIADRQIGSKRWAEWKGDIDSIATTLAMLSMDDATIVDTFRCVSDKDATDTVFVSEIKVFMLALCASSSTSDALEAFKPEHKDRIKETPHFKVMAEAADIARNILDTDWRTVLALAKHLCDVKQMSSKELTAFLEQN